MSKKLESVNPEPDTSPKNWSDAQGRAAVIADIEGQLPEKIGEMIALAGGRKSAAEAIGVAPTTLDNYRRGITQPKFLELLKLATAAGQSIESLLPSTDVTVASENSMAEFVPIPQLEVRPSAGHGALAQQPLSADNDVVAFREDWLRRIGVSPRFARLMFAKGDSMHDTIDDGDMMIVDVSIREVVDEGVYVVVYGGLVIVKRVQLLRTGGIVLKSDNPRYEPEIVPVDEQPELIVEGRVRWVGGEL